MSIHVPDIDTFTRAHPDTQFVDVLLPDLLSTPRGKRLKIDALPAVYAGAFRLPGSIFAMDASATQSRQRASDSTMATPIVRASPFATPSFAPLDG